jgi:hypothetical protein
MNKTCILIVIIVVASCSDVKKTPEPETLYSQEKMAEILYDMYLIDGTLQTNRRAFIDLKVAPDEYLYQNHKIDSVTFAKNLAYYNDRIDQYLEIVENVEEKINLKSEKIDSLRLIESKKEVRLDSLAPVKALKPIKE